MLKKLLYLDCAEALKFCDKAEYKETSLSNKLRLKLHLLFCESCKKYQQKNQKLSLLIKKARLKTCTREEKEVFKLRMSQIDSKDTPEK